MLITREHLTCLLAARDERDLKAKAATEAHAAVVALEAELIAAAPNQVLLVKLDDGTLRAITTGDEGNEFVGVMVATPIVAAQGTTPEPAAVQTTTPPPATETQPAAKLPDREAMRAKLADVAARAGADHARALLANSGKADRLGQVEDRNLAVLDQALDAALNKTPAVAA